MVRKLILAGLLWFAVGQSAAWAEAGGALVFGVNEGVSKQLAFRELQDKYKPLADALSQALKRPVRLVSSLTLKSAEMDLGKHHVDFIYMRPSNLAAKAIRDQKYVLVAEAKGDFYASFIVNKDSPLKKPEDIRGKRIAMPSPDSMMANAALATMRDMKINPAQEQIHYARLQEAVGYMVDQGFADVGVVFPPLAKDWEKKGGRILFKTKNLPFWCVIASPEVSADDVAKAREVLVNLDSSDSGQAVLKQIGVKGFIPGNQEAYLDLLKWTGQ